MNLYNLKIVEPGHYMIAKFDSDFNIAATYNLRAKGPGWTCDCPAGQRAVKLKPCKHQRALPFMLGAVNTERFYDIDTRTWHTPLSPELTSDNAEGAGLPANEPEPAPVSPKGVEIASHEPKSDDVDVKNSPPQYIPGEITTRLPAQPGPTQNATPIVTRRI